MKKQVQEVVRNKIKIYRQKKKLSQSEFARIMNRYGLDWKRDTVNTIEQGIRQVLVHEFVLLIDELGYDLFYDSKKAINDNVIPFRLVDSSEKHICKKFGIDYKRFKRLCLELWGKTYIDHRDEVVAKHKHKYKDGNSMGWYRAQIARELSDEIRKKLFDDVISEKINRSRP